MNLEFVIGIDIGGTNTKYAFVDKDGNVSSKDTIHTANYGTPEDFVKDLSDKLHSKFSTLNSQFILKGIGIGAPSANYFNGCIENSPNLRWDGIIPLVDLMKEHFDLPVFLTNDAKAAAMGELKYGGGRGMKNFIVITLGTGLGSGFIVDGEILYGSTSFAGELGHTIIDPEGRQCGCGRKGCLEQYASATGFTKTAVEMLEKSNESSLLRNYEPRTLNSKLIYEAALKGDKISLETFEFTGKILGRRLADTVAITSPEAIFLFGGLAESGDLILKPTEKYMNLYLLNNFKNTVKLMFSGVEKSNAAVLGAAALAWHNLS